MHRNMGTQLETSTAAYYDGSFSLFGEAYYENTNYAKDNPTAETWAHSQYANVPGATDVTIYMTGISRTRPDYWGWSSYIFLNLDDGSNQVQYTLYEYREWPLVG